MHLEPVRIAGARNDRVVELAQSLFGNHSRFGTP